jgi:hypothetical protein
MQKLPFAEQAAPQEQRQQKKGRENPQKKWTGRKN